MTNKNQFVCEMKFLFSYMLFLHTERTSTALMLECATKTRSGMLHNGSGPQRMSSDATAAVCAETVSYRFEQGPALNLSQQFLFSLYLSGISTHKILHLLSKLAILRRPETSLSFLLTNARCNRLKEEKFLFSLFPSGDTPTSFHLT